MTPEQRKAARERCDKATAGPWVVSVRYRGWPVEIASLERLVVRAHVGDSGALAIAKQDEAFLLAARTDLPAALDEIDRLEAELTKLRETLTA